MATQAPTKLERYVTLVRVWWKLERIKMAQKVKQWR